MNPLLFLLLSVILGSFSTGYGTILTSGNETSASNPSPYNPVKGNNSDVFDKDIEPDKTRPSISVNYHAGVPWQASSTNGKTNEQSPLKIPIPVHYSQPATVDRRYHWKKINTNYPMSTSLHYPSSSYPPRNNQQLKTWKPIYFSTGYDPPQPPHERQPGPDPLPELSSITLPSVGYHTPPLTNRPELQLPPHGHPPPPSHGRPPPPPHRRHPPPPHGHHPPPPPHKHHLPPPQRHHPPPPPQGHHPPALHRPSLPSAPYSHQPPPSPYVHHPPKPQHGHHPPERYYTSLPIHGRIRPPHRLPLSTHVSEYRLSLPPPQPWRQYKVVLQKKIPGPKIYPPPIPAHKTPPRDYKQSKWNFNPKTRPNPFDRYWNIHHPGDQAQLTMAYHQSSPPVPNQSFVQYSQEPQPIIPSNQPDPNQSFQKKPNYKHQSSSGYGFHESDQYKVQWKKSKNNSPVNPSIPIGYNAKLESTSKPEESELPETNVPNIQSENNLETLDPLTFWKTVGYNHEKRMKRSIDEDEECMDYPEDNDGYEGDEDEYYTGSRENESIEDESEDWSEDRYESDGDHGQYAHKRKKRGAVYYVLNNNNCGDCEEDNDENWNRDGNSGDDENWNGEDNDDSTEYDADDYSGSDNNNNYASSSDDNTDDEDDINEDKWNNENDDYSDDNDDDYWNSEDEDNYKTGPSSHPKPHPPPHHQPYRPKPQRRLPPSHAPPKPPPPPPGHPTSPAYPSEHLQYDWDYEECED